MVKLKVGDIVARKSYGYDIYFKVADITNNGGDSIITLKGISYRIQADAPESDLTLMPDTRINEQKSRLDLLVEKKCRQLKMAASENVLKKAYYRDTPKDGWRSFVRPGKVLHIDGDNDYLENCLKKYDEFGITNVGKYIQEKDQPSAIYKLLNEHKPDILVLTGHDGVIKGNQNYNDLSNYKNSKYFIESVKEARRYEKNLDNLVIFAGACQSMYNEIINSGANYASAPSRVLIHALDPVFVCHKVAFSGIGSIVDPLTVINSTITGQEGIGGIQTRGKYRTGYPSEPERK